MWIDEVRQVGLCGVGEWEGRVDGVDGVGKFGDAPQVGFQMGLDGG